LRVQDLPKVTEKWKSVPTVSCETAQGGFPEAGRPQRGARWLRPCGHSRRLPAFWHTYLNSLFHPMEEWKM
jgi:hypothetical protein